jgi:hypothetical protein
MSPVLALPLSELVAVSLLYKEPRQSHSMDFEMRWVIRFLNAKNICPAKIHLQLVEMYGEGVMNERTVHIWCHLFNV